LYSLNNCFWEKNNGVGGSISSTLLNTVEGVDWINLARDRSWWRVLVNRIINQMVP
jgi:hypothetical protein